MTINVEYGIEALDPPQYDLKGRKLVKVHERYTGDEETPEDQMFIVPGLVSEAFIRARRSIADRILRSAGYGKTAPVDWSFLKDLKS